MAALSRSTPSTAATIPGQRFSGSKSSGGCLGRTRTSFATGFGAGDLRGRRLSTRAKGSGGISRPPGNGGMPRGIFILCERRGGWAPDSSCSSSSRAADSEAWMSASVVSSEGTRACLRTVADSGSPLSADELHAALRFPDAEGVRRDDMRQAPPVDCIAFPSVTGSSDLTTWLGNSLVTKNACTRRETHCLAAAWSCLNSRDHVGGEPAAGSRGRGDQSSSTFVSCTLGGVIPSYDLSVDTAAPSTIS